MEGLEDTNVAGIYEGFFLYPMHMTLPWPSFDWDPAEAFAELDLVQRIGHLGIWQGRQVRPRARAWGMYGEVAEYIYSGGGADWALVARRLQEVVAVTPASLGAAVELSNAHLRLGDPIAAAAPLRGLLDQDTVPIEALVRTQVAQQLALLESAAAAAAQASTASAAPIPLLRNPWME